MHFYRWFNTPSATNKENSLLWLILTALYTLFLTANAIIYYPGLASWDLPLFLSEGIHLKSNGYQSIIYPVLIGESYLFFNSIYGIIALQNLLTLIVASYVLHLLQILRLKRWALLIVFLFFTLSPPIIGYANFYQRTIISGLINALLMFLLFKIVYCKVYFGQKPKRAEAWTIGILVFSCIIIRMENIILAMGVAGTLLLSGLLRGSLLCNMGLVLAPAFLIYYGFLVPAVKIKSESYRYLTMSLVNTVGVGVADGWIDENDTTFRPVIEKIIPLSVYKKSWNPYSHFYYLDFLTEQPAYEPINYQDALNFFVVYLKTLYHRPDAVLGYQLSNFIAALGSTDAENRKATISDVLGEDPVYYQKIDYFKKWAKTHTYLKRDHSHFPKWSNFLSDRFLSKNIGKHTWNCMPQLIFLALGLTILSRPVTALICATFGLRLLALFFLMPVSHMMYLYDLYLLGAIIPFMWFAENKMRWRVFS